MKSFLKYLRDLTEEKLIAKEDGEGGAAPAGGGDGGVVAAPSGEAPAGDVVPNQPAPDGSLSTTDVLGKCDHRKDGVFGPGCFHLPCIWSYPCYRLPRKKRKKLKYVNLLEEDTGFDQFKETFDKELSSQLEEARELLVKVDPEITLDVNEEYEFDGEKADWVAASCDEEKGDVKEFIVAFNVDALFEFLYDNGLEDDAGEIRAQIRVSLYHELAHQLIQYFEDEGIFGFEMTRMQEEKVAEEYGKYQIRKLSGVYSSKLNDFLQKEYLSEKPVGESQEVLTEGKHWPEDYVRQAYKDIKESPLGRQSWYTNEYILQDLIGKGHTLDQVGTAEFKHGLAHDPAKYGMLGEFAPLMHKNSNLGFFRTVIKWFIEYSGTSSQKYQEFIEQKLDSVIQTLLVILNDPSYDKIRDEIKQKWDFGKFEELVQKVREQNRADSDKKSADIRKRDDYELVKITSYEQLNDMFGSTATGYDGESEWCHTNGESTYDSWTSHGSKMFFVLAKKGWEDIKPPDPKTTNAYDEYGTSLIAILVRVSNMELLNATLRWNHIIDPSKTKPGATVDNAFKNNWGDLSQTVGMDVKEEVERQLTEERKELDKVRSEANAVVQQSLSKCVRSVSMDDIPRKYREYVTEVAIPHGVELVSDSAFQRCTSLRKVTIPNTVKQILGQAFEGCKSLEEVTIPDGVTSIGAYAFNGCKKLRSVTIPDSVKIIWACTFQGCTSLESAKLGRGSDIAVDMFGGCSALTSVSIPEGVYCIRNSAFSNCYKLREISLPDSVKKIDDYAFEFCGLRSITLPADIKLSEVAFEGCDLLTEIRVRGDVDTFTKQNYGKFLDGIRVVSADSASERIEEAFQQGERPRNSNIRLRTNFKHPLNIFAKRRKVDPKESASWSTDEKQFVVWGIKVPASSGLFREADGKDCTVSFKYKDDGKPSAYAMVLVPAVPKDDLEREFLSMSEHDRERFLVILSDIKKYAEDPEDDFELEVASKYEGTPDAELQEIVRRLTPIKGGMQPIWFKPTLTDIVRIARLDPSVKTLPYGLLDVVEKIDQEKDSDYIAEEGRSEGVVSESVDFCKDLVKLQRNSSHIGPQRWEFIQKDFDVYKGDNSKLGEIVYELNVAIQKTTQTYYRYSSYVHYIFSSGILLSYGGNPQPQELLTAYYPTPRDIVHDIRTSNGVISGDAENVSVELLSKCFDNIMDGRAVSDHPEKLEDHRRPEDK